MKISSVLTLLLQCNRTQAKRVFRSLGPSFPRQEKIADELNAAKLFIQAVAALLVIIEAVRRDQFVKRANSRTTKEFRESIRIQNMNVLRIGNATTWSVEFAILRLREKGSWPNTLKA